MPNRTQPRLARADSVHSMTVVLLRSAELKIDTETIPLTTMATRSAGDPHDVLPVEEGQQ